MDENTISLFGSRKTDHWQTPVALKEKLGVTDWFDPCPRHPTEDGLKIDWKQYTFVNPPYSKVKEWFEKAHSELLKNNCDVIKFLVFSNTDTKWFHIYCYNNDGMFYKTHLEFLQGRVSFIGDNGKTGPAMRPSVVVTFSRR